MRIRGLAASVWILGSLVWTGCPSNGGSGADAGPRDAFGGGMDAPPGPVCTTTGPENTLAACSDACDNEPDEAVDCNDNDCCAVRTDCPATTFCGALNQPDGGSMPCSETLPVEDTLESCSNGCDDDGNSYADCEDHDCCRVRSDCGPTTACGMPRPDAGPRDAGMTAVYTIAQLQNRADPMHPAPRTRVTVDQAGMVALTARTLVGAANGGRGRTCRFALWVGAAVSGDFTAIQVQESMTLPAGATSCFDLPANKISDAFAPGDSVTAINDATYDEFCTATGMMPCTDFEQSDIFLGGSSTIVRGAPGTPPAGTVVAVSDLVGADGAPGARSVALEGGLFTVENVRIRATTSMMGMTTFTTYSAFLEAAPTVALDIQVSNFRRTACVRARFDETATAGTDTITGVLLPTFGRWTLRVRDEGDVVGLVCDTPDAGM